MPFANHSWTVSGQRKFWRPEKDLHRPNSPQRSTHLMAIQSDRPSPVSETDRFAAFFEVFRQNQKLSQFFDRKQS